MGTKLSANKKRTSEEVLVHSSYYVNCLTKHEKPDVTGHPVPIALIFLSFLSDNHRYRKKQLIFTSNARLLYKGELCGMLPGF